MYLPCERYVGWVSRQIVQSIQRRGTLTSSFRFDVESSEELLSCSSYTSSRREIGLCTIEDESLHFVDDFDESL